jgi:hypothetical protein
MTELPIVLVLGTVLATGILLAIARWAIPDDPDRPHHDAAGAIFSMVGVLYAVVLAFVVIVVWENDGEARADSQVEASAVARVYFTARSLPEPQRSTLMTDARDYADVVAHQEWPLMARGRTSAQARQHVAAMRLTTHQLRPTTADQEILMGDTLDAIDELVDARRERTSALTAPLTPLMWSGLIVSSVLTIGFMFLFNQCRFVLHLLMVGSVAGLIAFILWLVYDLSLPFSGAAAVGPEAFDQILQRFREFPPGSPS